MTTRNRSYSYTSLISERTYREDFDEPSFEENKTVINDIIIDENDELKINEENTENETALLKTENDSEKDNTPSNPVDCRNQDELINEVEKANTDRIINEKKSKVQSLMKSRKNVIDKTKKNY